MGREDVRNYIVDAVSNVLSSGNIEYLKWDFNRHLTEIASESFSSQQQGEVTHRFILGTYEIMERITSVCFLRFFFFFFFLKFYL